MIKSMTGFGKAQISLGMKQISIDVRALNSKQFDLNMRIPGLLRSREAEIRQRIASVLERGKIDCYIVIKQAAGNIEINEELIQQRYKKLHAMAQQLGASSDAILPALLKLPDAFIEEEEDLAENQWELIDQALVKALADADAFRQQEGAGLEKELGLRVSNITKNMAEVAIFDDERIASLRAKLLLKVEQLAVEYDRNRFEEELIYYIEKLDISEEKQRLASHCALFTSTMKEQNSNGRKLNFIAQEMGREINTIGSKANHAGIQKFVVLMKDELEKIKEQLNNIV
jgi:uncharacterized protein (TIGR00255 family)